LSAPDGGVIAVTFSTRGKRKGWSKVGLYKSKPVPATVPAIVPTTVPEAVPATVPATVLEFNLRSYSKATAVAACARALVEAADAHGYELLAGAYSHRVTFRLNVSTFCGICWVHDFPPVYETGGHGKV